MASDPSNNGIDGDFKELGAKQEITIKKRELGLQILIFLVEHGPTLYERLHEEFGLYQSRILGTVLANLLHGGWIERDGRDRVKISDRGRQKTQGVDAE